MNLKLPLLLYGCIIFLLIVYFKFNAPFLLICLSVLTLIVIIYYLITFIKSIVYSKERFVNLLLQKSTEIAIVAFPLLIFAVFFNLNYDKSQFEDYISLMRNELFLKKTTVQELAISLPNNQFMGNQLTNLPYQTIDSVNDLQALLTSLNDSGEKSQITPQLESINFTNQVLILTFTVHGSCENEDWKFFQDDQHHQIIVTLIRHAPHDLICNMMAHMTRKIFLIDKPSSYQLKFQRYDI